MPPIVSQLVKIAVRPGFSLMSAEFGALRSAVKALGGREQYYGLCTTKEDDLLWVIQWPAEARPIADERFQDELNALDRNGAPQEWFLPFQDDALPREALEAPVCELCYLHQNPTVARASIAASLHKTYTDCDYALGAGGYEGGAWSTATNDERMNYYYLGWKSREHHSAFFGTEECQAELRILMPHMDAFGANFVSFEKEGTGL
ncbi:Glycoside hydrolase family 5 protein [Mycena kentingensis (nom. inval.)]|nr:Glycoside hydrolase family 5 protein [Mycena kentingensis (nom. inval.)]